MRRSVGLDRRRFDLDLHGIGLGVAGIDDLTEVKGIGPAFAARLAEIQILTFADLAAADPAVIAEAANTSDSAATAWIEDAASRA